MFALQPVPTRQVLLAATLLPFSQGAHQAAVAAVRHVSAGAAGTRTGTHITPDRTLYFGLCAGGLLHVQEHGCEQDDLHLLNESEGTQHSTEVYADKDLEEDLTHALFINVFTAEILVHERYF